MGAMSDDSEDVDPDASFLLSDHVVPAASGSTHRARSTTVDTGLIARSSATTDASEGSPRSLGECTNDSVSIINFDPLLRFQQTASAVIDSFVRLSPRSPISEEQVQALKLENAHFRAELELLKSHCSENEELRTRLKKLALELDAAKFKLLSTQRENEILSQQLDTLKDAMVHQLNRQVDNGCQTAHKEYVTEAVQVGVIQRECFSQVGESLNNLKSRLSCESPNVDEDFEELQKSYRILERKSQQKIKDLQKALGRALNA